MGKCRLRRFIYPFHGHLVPVLSTAQMPEEEKTQIRWSKNYNKKHTYTHATTQTPPRRPANEKS